ncbi:FkbM family methyltransferase [Vibrio parahaemolyticus]|uniref:FkbM family methyltransferase n=1 Tax=Vibrio parahaemolyticus TaxID=670 RepID=UPI00111E065E|nr:FkbM family methyltransferase [Vibrio parahaemolyticus]TOP91717.1 hypothetical protein CGH07_12610 [Vibrio parahaemolyticus]HCG5284339.1 FkbM family methyltransferase [Vibrio parahaemolyticus]
MENLLKTIPEKKYSNIIFAGFGTEENISPLMTFTEGSLIAIEPNSKPVESLKRKYSNVRLYPVALGVKDGKQKFYKYWPENLSTLSESVILPPGMKNARLIQEIIIETRTLKSIVNELGFNQDSNLLILSLNGLELEIINSLSENEFCYFSSIVIEIDNLNIFQQEGDYSSMLKEKLISYGYHIEGIENSVAVCRFLFSRCEEKKKLRSENKKLRSENKKLEMIIEELNEKNIALFNENVNINETSNALIDDIEQLRTLNNDLALKLEQNEKKAKDRETNLLSRISNLKSDISSFHIDKEKMEDIQKKIELDRDEAISKLINDNQEIMRSARINQKLLAKSQMDLDNLREKYSSTKESELELVDLISELRKKLSSASKYYHRLQDEHPELLDHIRNDYD